MLSLLMYEVIFCRAPAKRRAVQHHCTRFPPGTQGRKPPDRPFFRDRDHGQSGPAKKVDRAGAVPYNGGRNAAKGGRYEDHLLAAYGMLAAYDGLRIEL